MCGTVRVILLDDIKYNLVYLKQFLVSMGLDVEYTTSAYQALEWLKTKDGIHAVFTDYQMPELNGINFQQECKKKLRIEMGKELPAFILFSAFKENKVEREALKKGFLAFLKKPFDKNDLEDVIKRVIAGEHLKFNQVKRVLLATHDNLIHDYIQSILPSGAFQINWVNEIDDAVEHYKKDIGLSGILTTPAIGDADALLLKLACVDNIRYSDTGIVPEPPFMVLFSEGDFTDKRAQVEYIAKANLQGIKEIINLTENPGRILEVLGSDMDLGKNEVEDYKVLVVDDVAFNRSMICNILKKMNIEPIEAANGKDAMEKYRLDPNIRFVICDLLLPDMKGDELLRHCESIKRIGPQGEVESAPFLMVTACQERAIIEAAMKVGFIDWLPKPLKIDLIQSHTKKALKLA